MCERKSGYGSDSALQQNTTDRCKVADYYEKDVKREFDRLTKSTLHQSEWTLTRRLLDEYVELGSSVLDVGAGPGRYAEYLIRARNSRVGVIDLSPSALAFFRTRIAQNEQAKILFARVCSATNMDNIGDETFDHVLLMGPLYHLLHAGERIKVLTDTKRILKSGGLVFAAFISPYYLTSRLLKDPSLLDSAEFHNAVCGDGTVPQHLHENFTDHWCCWPLEARALMEQMGFGTVRMRNLEGVGTFLREEQQVLELDSRRKEQWFDFLEATCERPDLLGATIHFLYVGRKVS